MPESLDDEDTTLSADEEAGRSEVFFARSETLETLAFRVAGFGRVLLFLAMMKEEGKFMYGEWAEWTKEGR